MPETTTVAAGSETATTVQAYFTIGINGRSLTISLGYGVIIKMIKMNITTFTFYLQVQSDGTITKTFNSMAALMALSGIRSDEGTPETKQTRAIDEDGTATTTFTSALEVDETKTSTDNNTECMNTMELILMKVEFRNRITGELYPCDVNDQENASPPYIIIIDLYNTTIKICYLNENKTIHSYGDQMIGKIVTDGDRNIVPSIEALQLKERYCCGGVFYGAFRETHIITSPNYPSNYFPHMRCPYVFRCNNETSPEDCLIELKFRQFSFDEDANVRIRRQAISGLTTEETTTLAPYVPPQGSDYDVKVCQGQDTLFVSQCQSITSVNARRYCASNVPSKPYYGLNQVIMYLDTNDFIENQGFVIRFQAKNRKTWIYSNQELNPDCTCANNLPNKIRKYFRKRGKQKNSKQTKDSSLSRVKREQKENLKTIKKVLKKEMKSGGNGMVRRRLEGAERPGQRQDGVGSGTRRRVSEEGTGLRQRANDNEGRQRQRYTGNGSGQNPNTDGERPRQRQDNDGAGRPRTIQRESVGTNKREKGERMYRKYVNKEEREEKRRKNGDEEELSPSGRVVNGVTNKKNQQYPWLARVIQFERPPKDEKTPKDRDVDRMCGGTLISEKFVITSTTCCTYCRNVWEKKFKKKQTSRKKRDVTENEKGGRQRKRVENGEGDERKGNGGGTEQQNRQEARKNSGNGGTDGSRGNRNNGNTENGDRKEGKGNGNTGNRGNRDREDGEGNGSNGNRGNRDREDGEGNGSNGNRGNRDREDGEGNGSNGNRGNRDREDGKGNGSNGNRGNRNREDGKGNGSNGNRGNGDREDGEGSGNGGNRDRGDGKGNGNGGNRNREDGKGNGSNGNRGNRDREDGKGNGNGGNRNREDGKGNGSNGNRGNRDREDGKGNGNGGNRDRGDGKGNGNGGNRNREDGKGNRNKGNGGNGDREDGKGNGNGGNRDRGDGKGNGNNGDRGNRDREGGRDNGNNGNRGNRDREGGRGNNDNRGNRDREDGKGKGKDGDTKEILERQSTTTKPRKPLRKDIAVILGESNVRKNNLGDIKPDKLKAIWMDSDCVDKMDKTELNGKPLYPVQCPVLLELKKKVKFTRFIKPMCLPIFDKIKIKKEQAASIGFGVRKEGDKKQPKRAVEVTGLKVNKKCEKKLGMELDKTMLCTKGKKKTGHMCYGDEGSPLLNVKISADGYKQHANIYGILALPGCEPEKKNKNKDKKSRMTRFVENLYRERRGVRENAEGGDNDEDLPPMRIKFIRGEGQEGQRSDGENANSSGQGKMRKMADGDADKETERRDRIGGNGDNQNGRRMKKVENDKAEKETDRRNSNNGNNDNQNGRRMKKVENGEPEKETDRRNRNNGNDDNQNGRRMKKVENGEAEKETDRRDRSGGNGDNQTGRGVKKVENGEAEKETNRRYGNGDNQRRATMKKVKDGKDPEADRAENQREGVRKHMRGNGTPDGERGQNDGVDRRRKIVVGDNGDERDNQNGGGRRQLDGGPRNLSPEGRAKKDKYNPTESNGDYIDVWIDVKKYKKWILQVVFEGKKTKACQRPQHLKSVPDVVDKKGIDEPCPY